MLLYNSNVLSGVSVLLLDPLTPLLEVLDNVNEFADYGLLEFEENGSAKRPVVWYDEIDADLPLTPPSRQGHKANA